MILRILTFHINFKRCGGDISWVQLQCNIVYSIVRTRHRVDGDVKKLGRLDKCGR